MEPKTVLGRQITHEQNEINDGNESHYGEKQKEQQRGISCMSWKKRDTSIHS